MGQCDAGFWCWPTLADRKESVVNDMRQAVMTEPLITSRFRFDKFAEAYRYIEEQGETTIKVVIDFD